MYYPTGIADSSKYIARFTPKDNEKYYKSKFKPEKWPKPVRNPTIKCPNCGHDTGLNPNGFLMVIPPEGLKCFCGETIIRGNNFTL